MRRIVVWLVFAVVVGGALWWSLFPTEESQRPRQMTATQRDPGDVPAAEPSKPARPATTPPSAAARVPDGSLASHEDVDFTQPRVEEEAPKPVRTSVSRERFLVETKAASVASSLGLLTPVELENRVERAVPEGSVPPGQLEQAKADARRSILVDAAVFDYLAKEKLGPDASPQEIQRVSNLLSTYAPSNEREKIRDENIDKVAASLDGN